VARLLSWEDAQQQAEHEEWHRGMENCSEIPLTFEVAR